MLECHLLSDHSPDMPDGRKAVFKNSLVVTIQISTRQGAPVVADNHTVRVDHGNYLKNERVA